MKALLVVVAMLAMSIAYYPARSEVALDQASATGITARITPEQSESGIRNLYMGALFNGAWYLRDAGNNWRLYTAGPLPVAGQANLSAGAVTVSVTTLDISTLNGLQVYVAYGSSDADIFAPGHLAKIYTVALFTPGLSLLAGDIGGQGSIDGVGAAARFKNPSDITADAAGNLYVVDAGNFTIRKVAQDGVVTTLAGTAGAVGSTDGSGASARFMAPGYITIGAAGNLYVTDQSTIRKITPAGEVTTFAGTAGVSGSADGTGAAAQFTGPAGITADTAGNLYVTDNYAIRKITPAGMVTTLAGTGSGFYMGGSADGIGMAAQFAGPVGITADAAGNLYVADRFAIRKITPNGTVTTLAGTVSWGIKFDHSIADGIGAAAVFDRPGGISVGPVGNLYVTDNGRIRTITADGVVTTLAGVSAGGAIKADSTGNQYVTDPSSIRRISPDGSVTTLAGKEFVPGAADGIGAAAQFRDRGRLAADAAGNVYFVDGYDPTVRKITPDGTVTTFAGTAYTWGGADGIGAAARFAGPFDITADLAGNLYATDNYAIRKITPDRVVTTFAGTTGIGGTADGSGAAARFLAPRGITTDSAGNLYVTDTYNPYDPDSGRIRKITPDGAVSTLAAINGSDGVKADPMGNLYVVTGLAANGYTSIGRITASGVMTTFAGTAGVSGSADGIGTAARFNDLKSIATDPAGNVYAADAGNHTIRKITPAGVVTTVAGVPGRQGIMLGGLPGGLDTPSGIALIDPNTLAITSNGSVLKLVLP